MLNLNFLIYVNIDILCCSCSSYCMSERLFVSFAVLCSVLVALEVNWYISMSSCSLLHYDDVIMGAMASQITSLTIVYSTVYSDADQRKHQSSASLAFVRGIHLGPVNSPHKWPGTQKMFPFDDVIMAIVMAASLTQGRSGKYHLVTGSNPERQRFKPFVSDMTGGRLDKKNTPSYQYRDPHDNDALASWSRCYPCHGNSHTLEYIINLNKRQRRQVRIMFQQQLSGPWHRNIND